MHIKRFFSWILVAAILIANIGCVRFPAASNNFGRNYRHSASRNRNSNVNVAESIAATGIMVGGLVILDALLNPWRAYPPEPRYVPPECAEFIGNERALNQCERVVIQRQINDQRRLEREAYQRYYRNRGAGF